MVDSFGFIIVIFVFVRPRQELVLGELSNFGVNDLWITRHLYLQESLDRHFQVCFLGNMTEREVLYVNKRERKQRIVIHWLLFLFRRCGSLVLTSTLLCTFCRWWHDIFQAHKDDFLSVLVVVMRDDI